MLWRLVVITAALLPAGWGKECPHGWTSFGTACYQTMPRQTWYEAEEGCRQHGAHLVSIHSAEEMDFLIKEAKRRWFLEDKIWTGLTTLYNKSAAWSDETPVDFTAWGGEKEGGDKCTALVRLEGRWEKNNCGQQFASYCKIPSGSAQVPLPPLPNVPLAGGNCPEGWLQHGRKCFLFVTEERKSWDEARATCRQMGKDHDLASIHSMEEQQFVNSYLAADRPKTWIGLKKLSNNYGTASWSDNSRVTFNNWAAKSPKPLWDPCVQMIAGSLDTGLWESANCSLSRPFLCQRSPDPSFPPSPESCPTKKGFSSARISSKGLCLYLSSAQSSWQSAGSRCEEQGWSLASIKDAFEAGTLHGLLEGVNDEVWLGLRQVPGTYRMEWVDGTPMEFSRWERGQPTPGMDGQCVVSSETRDWVLRPCGTARRFVCMEERDVEVRERSGQDRCPPHRSDWIDVGGSKCYLLQKQEAQSWGQAFLDCFINDATLASVQSEAELRALQTYLSCPDCPRHLWLGAARKHNGTWSWIDDSTWNYTRWGPGQPQKNPWLGGSRRCVLLNALSLEWLDEGCSSLAYYFCSVPKVRNQDLS